MKTNKYLTYVDTKLEPEDDEGPCWSDTNNLPEDGDMNEEAKVDLSNQPDDTSSDKYMSPKNKCYWYIPKENQVNSFH